MCAHSQAGSATGARVREALQLHDLMQRVQGHTNVPITRQITHGISARLISNFWLTCTRDQELQDTQCGQIMHGCVAFLTGLLLPAIAASADHASQQLAVRMWDTHHRCAAVNAGVNK